MINSFDILPYDVARCAARRVCGRVMGSGLHCDRVPAAPGQICAHEAHAALRPSLGRNAIAVLVLTQRRCSAHSENHLGWGSRKAAAVTRSQLRKRRDHRVAQVAPLRTHRHDLRMAVRRHCVHRTFTRHAAKGAATGIDRKAGKRRELQRG